jgi:hypothetical protein
MRLCDRAPSSQAVISLRKEEPLKPENDGNGRDYLHTLIIAEGRLIFKGQFPVL